MIRNQKFKYLTTTIAGVASLAFVLLFFFVYRTFPKSNPNVFLEFQYTSKDYYKILINDSLIIDSQAIINLKYKNEHYKTKSLGLKLDKGDYIVQIKDSVGKVLSESKLKIDNSEPKYIYFRKEIIIKDKPYILI